MAVSNNLGSPGAVAPFPLSQPFAYTCTLALSAHCCYLLPPSITDTPSPYTHPPLLCPLELRRSVRTCSAASAMATALAASCGARTAAWGSGGGVSSSLTRRVIDLATTRCLQGVVVVGGAGNRVWLAFLRIILVSNQDRCTVSA